MSDKSFSIPATIQQGIFCMPRQTQAFECNAYQGSIRIKYKVQIYLFFTTTILNSVILHFH